MTKKSTKILSLDISSSNTGWAVGSKDIYEFGSISFSEYRGDYGELFSRYEGWLLGQINKHNPVFLSMEGVNRGLQGNARYLLTTMNGITKKTSYEESIPWFEYAPTSIKKHTTGSGRASKEEMVEAVTKMGYEVNNADEADAVGIWLMTREEINAR